MSEPLTTSPDQPVPVIDFAPFRSGTDVERQAVAEAIGRACREVGFFYLRHHGVDPNLIESAFAESRGFFARPLDEKQAVAWSDEASNRGYVAVERESLDPNRPGDLKEAFNVGRDEPLGLGENAALRLNQWPVHSTQFQSVMEAFFEACAVAADEVLHAFALALRTPPEFFVRHHDQRDHTMRLLHYPPVGDTAVKPDQIRAGGHTDYGSITLLFQDEVGGLEVQSVDGVWQPAPPLPGAMLVNTGDLMQRWTNDVFRSTPHRVGLPPAHLAHRYRDSIVFFCHPNMASRIECLESCIGPDRPVRYPPIDSQAHLMERLEATYN